MEAERSEVAEWGPGQVPAIGGLVGPYRVLRRLGAGTTGTVFEVEHERIARRAAMKVFSPIVPVPGVADRFLVEAQAVNAIKDPHVVEITDILEAPEGHPVALVMELLEGRSLADVIAGERRLPAARVLRILAHVCKGLAAVHAAGFVHRDVKPENVFLVQRDADPDFVKLLDFGLVKACGDRGPRSGCATLAGTFLGSPAYASPEQAAGSRVDFRSDIYSLAVLAFELLTGELPFMAEGYREVLLMQMTAPPPPLPAEIRATELGQTLDEILQTCLSKDPNDRAYSAPQLAEMFCELAEGEGASRLRLRFKRDTRRWRHGALLAPVALAALGLLLFARHHAGRPVESAALAAAPAAPVVQPLAQASEAPRSPAVAAAGDQNPEEPRDQPKLPNKGRRASRTARLLSEATTLNPFQ